jgi:hypothetical protein
MMTCLFGSLTLLVSIACSSAFVTGCSLLCHVASNPCVLFQSVCQPSPHTHTHTCPVHFVCPAQDNQVSRGNNCARARYLETSGAFTCLLQGLRVRFSSPQSPFGTHAGCSADARPQGILLATSCLSGAAKSSQSVKGWTAKGRRRRRKCRS